MTDLAPEEFGSLMDAIKEGRDVMGVDAVQLPTPWDLTNPGRNLPDPMPALEAAHEVVARRFQAALCGRTRTRSRVRPLGLHHGTPEELAPLMTPPVVIGVIELDGPEVPLLLVERSFTEQLLAAGLGLSESSFDPDDLEFTRLERLLLERLLGLFLIPLIEGYRPITPLRIRGLRLESDHRLAEPDASGPLLMGGFEVSGALAGRITLALPFSIVEAARARLVRPAPKFSPDPEFQRRLRTSLEDVPLTICVDLGEAWSSVREVSELRPGDTLPLSALEGAPLPLRVNDVVKAWARPSARDGGLIVEIVKIADRNRAENAGNHPRATRTPVEEDTMHEDRDPSMERAAAAQPPVPQQAARVQLLDVPLKITVELGRSTASVADVMQWTVGSVINLDKLAGEPLDVLLNGRLIGSGEAVVIGERFGVRLTTVVGDDQ